MALDVQNMCSAYISPRKDLTYFLMIMIYHEGYHKEISQMQTIQICDNYLTYIGINNSVSRTSFTKYLNGSQDEGLVGRMPAMQA